MDKKYTGKSAARSVVLVGMMAATVECGKLALSFLPNVEVVTILLALYGYVFGFLGIASAFVFVCVEPLIYGFNTWVITYFIYWPLVAFVFMLLGKARVKQRWIFPTVAVLLTVFFGVLSSLVDVGLLTGYFDRFFYRFAIYYARGVVFYAVQIAANAVLFTVLFPLLARKLQVVKKIFI
jgi:hypothetical protein